MLKWEIVQLQPGEWAYPPLDPDAQGEILTITHDKKVSRFPAYAPIQHNIVTGEWRNIVESIEFETSASHKWDCVSKLTVPVRALQEILEKEVPPSAQPKGYLLVRDLCTMNDLSTGGYFSWIEVSLVIYYEYK